MVNMRDEIKKELIDFKQSMSNINTLWSSASEEENAILEKGYPFGKSFDELFLEVCKWVDTATF